MNLTIGIVLLITLTISIQGSSLLIRWLKKKGVLDIPNLRSSHQQPTPRGGGLAIIISLLTGIALLAILTPYLPIPGWGFFAGLVIVALAGFLDDRFSLPVAVRFLIYAGAASLVFWETGGFQYFPLPEPYLWPLGWLSLPLTLFWVIAIINIYNFLDGIDGYAALQAIVAAAGMMWLDYGGAGFFFGMIMLTATAGFLVYNWHPARIFMGDIGSASLGYIFAAIPFYFTETSTNLGIFSMGIFLWFFLADGAFTIIRRLLRGEKIWEAHRTHLYQQLVTIYPHHKVAFGIMAVAAILIFTYLSLFNLKNWNQIWILPVAILFFVAYYYFVHFIKKRNVSR